MLDRYTGVRHVEDRYLFYFELWRVDTDAVAGFDSRLPRMKAPPGYILIASRDLNVRRDNRVETYLLYAISSEIEPCPVLSLICVAGGVDEVAGLGSVVPISA